MLGFPLMLQSAEKPLPLKMLFMVLHFITHSSLRKLAWDSVAKVCFKKGEVCVVGGKWRVDEKYCICKGQSAVSWEREHFVPA